MFVTSIVVMGAFCTGNQETDSALVEGAVTLSQLKNGVEKIIFREAVKIFMWVNGTINIMDISVKVTMQRFGCLSSRYTCST